MGRKQPMQSQKRRGSLQLVTPRKFARTAIVYDFDGTLASGNMQEHSFLPNHVNCSIQEFWDEVGRLKQAHDADQILIYMMEMVRRSRVAKKPISAKSLEEHGRSLPYMPGVREWFQRIDTHAASQGLGLEHYVVSSGNEEIIRGSEIFRHFKKVFGSRYLYDDDGFATWPAVVVNYTTKTQFLFRINKGVRSTWEDEPVNRWIPMKDRPVPFTRMIYIGDGDTDIPSMKMVRHQGGHSVAVFDPKKWETLKAQPGVYNLIAENRADFVVPADYQEGSQLDVTIKGILGRIARDAIS
jgi:phosphoserine phosphatase